MTVTLSMSMAGNASTVNTQTNQAQAQKAYAGLEELLRSGLDRNFSGTITVECDIKQGSILNVEAIQRRRL